MPKAAPGSLAPGEMESFNDGYKDGYNGESAPSPATWAHLYLRGWTAGMKDKIDDLAALASGINEPLTPDEALGIYGVEERMSEYRGTS